MTNHQRTHKMFFPTLYSRTEGQNLNIRVAIIYLNLVVLLGIGITGIIYAEQFVFTKQTDFEPTLVPFYNVLPVGIQSGTYIFTFYWIFVVFLDKIKVYVYVIITILCIAGIKRPNAYAVTILVCLGELFIDGIRLIWVTKDYFDCKNAFLCRSWTYPYTSTDINPIYKTWWILQGAHLFFAIVLTVQISTLKYVSHKQCRAERLEGVISVGGKRSVGFEDQDDSEEEEEEETSKSAIKNQINREYIEKINSRQSDFKLLPESESKKRSTSPPKKKKAKNKKKSGYSANNHVHHLLFFGPPDNDDEHNDNRDSS